ncbi:retinoid-inducible serine carboxypeptidase [Patella vulgata]|uniref:retinoid-inducible serine carboxypeptidase n=1 Tax=Patella vulgata TaxID=6465 RepID=UPI00217FE60E|nr:retinoid-inducible serine carboxypeptidase [Patella vulgata]
MKHVLHPDTTVTTLIISIFIISIVNSKTINVRDDREVWDYVTVRPSAHMFYWHYDTINSAGFKNVPYVLWLQGGPGGSSTGFGNFGEIGPLGVDLKPRNTTWLQYASLLFIDNPVGTGYSYVDNDSAYTTDVQMIANDLFTVLTAVMEKVPGFQSVPFYIFSESYGGKMTAAFSQVLYDGIQAGKISCNFKGLAMGDSWISPIDSVLTWAPYLYTNSLVDLPGYKLVEAAAMKTKMFIEKDLFLNATAEWGATESIVEQVTNGVNFYNILEWGGSDKLNSIKLNQNLGSLEKLWKRHVGVYQAEDLAALMNGPIREKLRIIPNNVTWGGQSGMVFTKQSGDFMKPVTDIVNNLINKTPLSVVVYSGQLDLIVDTLGTESWVNRLNIAEEFNSASRKPILNPMTDLTSGFVKKAKNFSFYWILDAGHMVPSDNGPTAAKMLRMITNQDN